MHNYVFVFGSNCLGIHGKGAALEAKERWGAEYGIPYGRQGDSFAIPTKLTPYKSLSLPAIRSFVEGFILYAKQHPEIEFLLTPIGCGLAGYTPKDIAPMFKNAPLNVQLPEEFESYFNSQFTIDVN